MPNIPGGSVALADAERINPQPRKRSDLAVRSASAVVMIAVAGAAFWLGGLVLTGFIVAVGLGILAEWTMLVLAFEKGIVGRAIWLLAGVGYIGLACLSAVPQVMPPLVLLAAVGSVIAVDVGAYFAGRSLGGPKIAPTISPSKTWSGLGGGMLAAMAFYAAFSICLSHAFFKAGLRDSSGLDAHDWLGVVTGGLVTAIVAQTGDFFESWMKRRAGVKDSSHVIPGHGGLFDRADGLIAVLFVSGVLELASAMVEL